MPPLLHNAAMRCVLLTLGAVSLAIGIAALIVPALPTTPFLMIAAACFARSSTRFHKWLIEHRFFGPMIRRWQETGGMTLWAKALIIAPSALIMGAYVVLFPWWTGKIIAGIFGLVVIVATLRVKTIREPK